MACIYYIKHKETGKTYIGQTVQPLEQRMRQHLAGNTEIDRALQSLGIHSFDYGVIEQCKSEELDEKEIYYIAKYNTYYNGYNNQLGGRKTGQNKYDSIIENIRQDYINGMSMIDLNIKYRIKSESIRYFVKDLNRQVEKEYTFDSKIIIGYTKDWQRIGVFESIKEALRFVNNQRQKEGKPVVDERNFYRTIKTACTKNGIASGYRWQYAEDVFYNGLQFNSSIDKQNYIIGLNCECKDNIWYTVKNKNKTMYIKNSNHKEDNNTSTNYKETKINKEEFMTISHNYTARQLAEKYNCTVASVRSMAYKLGATLKQELKLDENCSVCNKLGVYKDNLCISCYNVKIKGKSPKPSKEQLIDDLKTLNINEIAKKYDRTPSTVFYWLNNYGLRQAKTNDTFKKLVHCIELNLTFNSLRDAAYGVYNSFSDGVANKISKAAKSGELYRGYHWKLIDKQ